MNTVHRKAFSIDAFIRQNPVQVLLVCIGIFAVILFLILIIYHQKWKSGRAAALELQRHTRLYAVSNDYMFEYNYRNKSMMVSLPENGEKTGGQRVFHYDMSNPPRNEEELKSRTVMQGFLESRESRVFEKQLYGPDGRWHWFKIVMEVILDDDGKPFYAVGRLNVIDAEKTEKEKLLVRAQRDSLTRLDNIESCRQQISAELASMKEGEYGALLILDIDYFKSVNATYGHMRGDAILREVAGGLQKNFREKDIVGRPGGDEFIVYMYRVRDTEALREKCESICQVLRRILLEAGRHITVSMGAAFSTPGQDYTDLYERADKALYAAKDAGRDCFVIPKPDSHSESD